MVWVDAVSSALFPRRGDSNPRKLSGQSLLSFYNRTVHINRFVQIHVLCIWKTTEGVQALTHPLATMLRRFGNAGHRWLVVWTHTWAFSYFHRLLKGSFESEIWVLGLPSSWQLMEPGITNVGRFPGILLSLGRLWPAYGCQIWLGLLLDWESAQVSNTWASCWPCSKNGHSTVRKGVMSRPDFLALVIVLQLL